MKKILIVSMAAAVITFAAGVVIAADSKMLQIKGSDTLINFTQKLSEVYMKKYPDRAIAVTGGGSGTGIAALVNGKCDIANSSRTMKAKEVESAMAKGIDPKRVVVAIDGLCVITNCANPVCKLTVEQIGKIYKGEITNWQEVGGSNMPINLYGRQSNSGTYDFMKENVMNGEYSPALKSMNGNAQIVEAIKKDASGIGYVGVGYAKESTGITVIKVASNPALGYYDPFSIDDVKSGRYPITRPLNQYINGIPSGAVRDFIIFELSKEGQAIIEEDGFFAIPDEYRNYNNSTLGITYAADEPISQKINSVEGQYAK